MTCLSVSTFNATNNAAYRETEKEGLRQDGKVREAAKKE
jgi:hypothetical protein